MIAGSEILFIAHRVPFPPDRGDKIRSHHILKALTKIAPVHVATFAESNSDLLMEAELAAVSASHCLVRRVKPLAAAGVEALIRRCPISQTAFHSAELEAYIARTLGSRPIRAIYVFSGQMGMYLPSDWAGRTIIDLVDVDSAKFEAYGALAGWPMSAIYRREGMLLAVEERRLATFADRTLLVSDEEAELLRSRVGDLPSSRIEALRNGIDSRQFDPAQIPVHEALEDSPGPHIVFTGQMDYLPNIAAATRIIDNILPSLREVYPAATFHCVGRDPAASLVARHGREGVRVWGQVPDVRAFLKSADLALVPLEIARGVQNKVLEAMAMACPVLLTPEAAGGIGAEEGVHYEIAGSDEELVSSAIALIANKTRATQMGAAARQFVAEHLSWETALRDLPAMLNLERGGVTGGAGYS